MIKAPYLLFIGGESDPVLAKTATGIHYWRPERCGGVLRFEGNTLDYGLPVCDVAEAARAGLQTLIVGVAPPGGEIQGAWLEVIVEALYAGLDVAAGLHNRLNDIAEVRNAAKASGRRVFDVRFPERRFPVGTGRRRSGRRILTVGTDCGVGKKFTALAIERELSARSVACTFRATGQTGILIAGTGVCVDAVVADFVSGAAETLSPENREDHWDIIEGQGSLFHPGYAGVSLGLLHGSQPDAIVLCHEAGRETLRGFDSHAVPGLKRCIDLNLRQGRLTNPGIACAGVSVNTMRLAEAAALSYLDGISSELELPAVDPVRFGVSPIVDYLLGTRG